jgi:glycosyltransferase involved in cell wall biosynthesis
MKKKFTNYLILGFWTFFSLFCFKHTVSAEEAPLINLPRSLNINIVAYRNGVGLDQDIDILERELKKLGHNINFVHFNDETPRKKVDINIFVEVVNEKLFQYADKNYLIPNPEWFIFSHQIIPKFDKILAKTKESARIFRAFNPNTEFLSFTCDDRFDSDISKNYKQALHLAGKSIQKNTHEVVKAWQMQPDFPLLILVKSQNPWEIPKNVANIKHYDQYLSTLEISNILNFSGVHICPSSTEGFGHYIMEAFSCGAVVITTDGPPMNEFVTDKRCLIVSSHTSPNYLAVNYHINPNDLSNVVGNLFNLSEDELKAIGKRNREFYLENDRFFKTKLAEIFPSINKKNN